MRLLKEVCDLSLEWVLPLSDSCLSVFLGQDLDAYFDLFLLDDLFLSGPSISFW